MSRVELLGVERAPLLVRPFYRDDGSASPITRALAQVPELAEVALPFIARVYGETAVDMRTKEIVVLRVSSRMGCRYCTDTHTVAAWEAGLTRAETQALRDEAGEFGERDAALVAWCDAICAAPAALPETALERLREHFAEHELVELTLLAGATLMLNRLCTALELPVSAATRQRLEAEQ